jgi:very-short-patch-repair endonuclease
VIHRRSLTAEDFTTRHNIPVTTPICTLIDIAARLSPRETERAVNEADKLDLVDPETLREALDATDPRPGVARLRRLLDYRTFTLTDSMNEQRFVPIARAAGLPKPETQQWVNGYRVDFYWPDLDLVVETDGLRYHRTPAEQAKDRLRDQVHAAAGITALRFTRAQVKFEPEHVEAVLAAVARRLYSRAQ